MFHDASTSLFLGDLSVYCTEKDVFSLFQGFGPIESIQLKRKSTSNGRPSYGFIQFRFKESAEEALRVMNGRVVHGRAIRLGWAEPPKVNVKVTTKRAEPRQLASTEFLERGLHIETAQVHFSYVTSRTAPLKEDIFRNVFQHFGTVLDVAIKKSQYQQDKGVQTGYGFIHYPLTEEGVTSAMEAVKSLHELVLDSVKYSCRVSHALEEYIKLRSLGGTLPPALNDLQTLTNSSGVAVNRSTLSLASVGTGNPLLVGGASSPNGAGGSLPFTNSLGLPPSTFQLKQLQQLQQQQQQQGLQAPFLTSNNNLGGVTSGDYMVGGVGSDLGFMQQAFPPQQQQQQYLIPSQMGYPPQQQLGGYQLGGQQPQQSFTQQQQQQGYNNHNRKYQQQSQHLPSTAGTTPALSSQESSINAEPLDMASLRDSLPISNTEISNHNNNNNNNSNSNHNSDSGSPTSNRSHSSDKVNDSSNNNSHENREQQQQQQQNAISYF